MASKSIKKDKNKGATLFFKNFVFRGMRGVANIPYIIFRCCRVESYPCKVHLKSFHAS